MPLIFFRNDDKAIMTDAPLISGCSQTGGQPEPAELLPRAQQAEAARVLSRLFGDPTPLEEPEARRAVRVLHWIHPDEFAQYLDDPKGFRTAWNEEKGRFAEPSSRFPLEESVYKEWTADTSHPLGGTKGLTWGDPARHMQDVLESFGMVVDPNELRAPDHIGVLLEFLAFLIGNRPRGEVEAFSRDHLDWIPRLLQEAESTESEGILTLLIRTTERLVLAVIS
jgi:hypothetical protein